jgi:hypothetical protein
MIVPFFILKKSSRVWLYKYTSTSVSIHAIVLKPASVRRVDPGLESGRIDKKIEKVMTWCYPADLAG